MNEWAEAMPDELVQIGEQLSQAIRRDLKQSSWRPMAARRVAIIVAATVALSGTALAAGQALGVIDLDHATRATPVTTTPAGNDPAFPYRYKIDGIPGTTGVKGSIYIESSQPLKAGADGRLTVPALGMHRCGLRPTSVYRHAQGTAVLVLDASCGTAHP